MLLPALPFSPRDGVQALLDLVGEGNAARPARRVVEDDALLAGAFGVVEDERRAELAHRRGREAGGARQLQDRVLAHVVAVEVLVDLAQYRVVLQRCDRRVTRA